ncbi:MAG TPA: methyltransferase domain-containing protein [Verrucomicrobiae bacterium]|jgi:ubiquinone/menaquinone biosynthesis C-methylase UbiE|nr:methyltransferase domain-containing protein [Verrucomicrobiae bacterium]
MGTAMSQMEQLKKNMKAAWMAGDFGQIAKYNEEEGVRFIKRLEIRRGSDVLDVACGTGNTAIPVARDDANVIGVDIATNLLEQARARAASEGLKVEFREGDAEALPFGVAEFDVVVSMFGAMFAPRPALVVTELTRVCRVDGFIAMANWTPTGLIGKNFAINARYLPPPENLEAPVLWGKEEIVAERFSKVGWKVETTRRQMEFKYPHAAAGVVKLFREYFGPTKIAFSRLDAAGQQGLATDMEKLWADHNEGPADQTHVKAEYLEVIARKA